VRIIVCVRGLAGDQTGLALGRGSATAVSFGLGLRASAGSTVTALSVAADAEPLLRGVGARGADAGVHVVAAPATRSGIARAIAGAAAAVGFELVVLGPDSAMAAMVAELLDVPLLDCCATLTLSGSEALAERRTQGDTELVAAPLPCVVSVDVDAAPVRHPDLPGILRARTMPLRRLWEEGLPLLPDPAIAATPGLSRQRRVEGAGDGALALVELLAREGVLE